MRLSVVLLGCRWTCRLSLWVAPSPDQLTSPVPSRFRFLLLLIFTDNIALLRRMEGRKSLFWQVQCIHNTKWFIQYNIYTPRQMCKVVMRWRLVAAVPWKLDLTHHFRNIYTYIQDQVWLRHTVSAYIALVHNHVHWILCVTVSSVAHTCSLHGAPLPHHASWHNGKCQYQ